MDLNEYEHGSTAQNAYISLYLGAYRRKLYGFGYRKEIDSMVDTERERLSKYKERREDTLQAFKDFLKERNLL